MAGHDLVRLKGAGTFPTVSLMDANGKGYILLAAEIDHRPPFAYFIESTAKRTLIGDIRTLMLAVESIDGVDEATLFKALIIPPGRGAYLKQRPEIPAGRFDIALMIQTTDAAAAKLIAASAEFAAVEKRVRQAAKLTYRMIGENLRRIGEVDHTKDGVFLINYFVADDEKQNLAVWDYTAGWFQDQTGLDNSVLTRPLEQDGVNYTIINHCRWDSLRDIVPSLLFKPSFRRYVLKHFEANDTAATPILYRLA